MNLLALDLGSRVGWAVQRGCMVCTSDAFNDPASECAPVRESGVRDFTPAKGDPLGVKFLDFSVWLEDMFDVHHPEAVAYEQVFFMLKSRRETIQLLFGMVTLVQMTCAAYKLPDPVTVNANSLKKWTTGGAKVLGHRASKADMLRSVRDRWKPGLGEGHACASPACREPVHDEADALAVLMFAREKYGTGATV